IAPPVQSHIFRLGAFEVLALSRKWIGSCFLPRRACRGHPRGPGLAITEEISAQDKPEGASSPDCARGAPAWTTAGGGAIEPVPWSRPAGAGGGIPAV